MKDEIQILNRTLRWTKECDTHEADQRLAEIVIKEMNTKKANAVSTPTVPEPSEEANSRLRSADMTKDEASRFRELFARVNYVSLDQPDLQFAAKASQHISLLGRKTCKSQPKSTRLGGQQDHEEIHQWRRDVFGQALGKVVEFMVLSSGEAEVYRMLKGATQTKGLISMVADFGEKVVAAVYSDASAAMGIAHRHGLGKTRHIEVPYLWIQHEVKEGKLTVKKVGTHNNPSNLLTNAMNGEGDEVRGRDEFLTSTVGRASTAPKLLTDSKLACSVTNQSRRPHRRALRLRGGVRIRSPDSGSAACASRVEKPNPTGDDHKWRQESNRAIPKEDGRM